jgi:exodeoxyribonuclease III
MSPSSAKKKKAPRGDGDGDDDYVIITTAVDDDEKPPTKKAKYPENPLGPPVPLQALKNDFFSHPYLPVWSAKNATFKGQKFVAVAFNVAGLRAMLKNKPECLRAVVDKTECDVLMFSEHKLNPENVDEATKQLKALLPEFSTVKFACSTAKKGYAGVCILARSACKEMNNEETAENGKGGAKSPMKQTSIKDMFGGGGGKKKETPTPTAATTTTTTTPYDGPKLLKVTEGLLDGKKHLSEGRAITLEYETFNAVFTYVPNSGQKLDRLDWRINTWEKECREHLNALQAKKPTIYGGDLNVAHLDIDIYNVDAKHIPKTAGTTAEERNAFGVMMKECKMKDAFRHFNPTQTGWFSYWSQRAGNRPRNRGLRLDYFLASDGMFKHNAEVKVISSGMLTEMEGSDHCPVYITLDVQK